MLSASQIKNASDFGISRREQKKKYTKNQHK